MDEFSSKTVWLTTRLFAKKDSSNGKAKKYYLGDIKIGGNRVYYPELQMHVIHNDLIELLTEYEIILQSKMSVRHLNSHEYIMNPIGRKVPIRIDPMQSVPVKCRILNFSNAISTNGIISADGNIFADDLDYFEAVNEIKNILGDKNKNVKLDDLFEIPICETTGNYCLPVERNQLFFGSHSISGGSEIEIPGKNGEFFNTHFIQGKFSANRKRLETVTEIERI